MKRATAVLLLGNLVVLTGTAFGQALLGTTFSYQGKLDDGGAPAGGSYDMQFKLYNSLNAQVGSTICADNVGVVDGLFTVQVDFGAAVFNGEARSLEIGVRADNTMGNCAAGAYTTLMAKQPIRPAPYALQTRGLFVNDALNVGIGALAPGAKLEVSTASGPGVLGRAPSGSNGMNGFSGAAAAFPFTDDAGVRGDGTGMTGAGLLGVSADYVGVVGYTDAGSIGVFGRHDGPGGTAVLGWATDTGGIALHGIGETAALLEGKVTIADTTSLGIAFSGHGEASTDTGIGHPSDGVLTLVTDGVERARVDANGALLVNSTSITAGAGTKFHSQTGACATWNTDSNSAVAGETSSGVALDGITDSGIGVVGACQSNTVGTAGFFVGRVSVLGTFTATTKNFRIDHPLDPANKYLEHGCIESDQYVNLYRGNVVLDASGSAWVQLPDWFEALNNNFNYQLTAIGASMPNLYVAEEVTSNRFQIAGGRSGGRVSWQVTGERHDAFAQAYPLTVEREKEGPDRGRYLHPVEHGASEDLQIGPLTRHAEVRQDAPADSPMEQPDEHALPQAPPPGGLSAPSAQGRGQG